MKPYPPNLPAEGPARNRGFAGAAAARRDGATVAGRAARLRPEAATAHGVPLCAQRRAHAGLDAMIRGRGFELPAILEPLAAVKDEFLVLSGLTLEPGTGARRRRG